MEWRDEGLIIGVKKYGETSVILEAMTRAHGRHAGLVKGGRSKRMQPLLQPGNEVILVWRARLEDHLGLYQVEPIKLRAARLMASAAALQGVNLLGALLRLLAERDPHEALYEAACVIVEHLEDKDIAAVLILRFELVVLAELGFGLDLKTCAATGTSEDLVYVSPKSGRAVSAAAGAPYHDKMLPLPDFLRPQARSATPSPADLRAGFQLTEYFLRRNLFEPRGLALPDSRSAFLAELNKAAAS
ncbi:MAG: DNA repair protein RecO [Beijerinckiaceae bacterium]